MKIGSFNINDYIEKIHENVNDKNLSLNEEDGGKLPNADGIIIPEEGKKAYDWLKKEYQKGKTEVKVEISSHDFKPGYNLDTNVKSVKDFKPGMYGNVKTSDNENNKREKAVPFPETKFPGGESKGNIANDKKQKNESSKEEDKDGKDDKEKSKLKVEAKTKDKKELKQS